MSRSTRQAARKLFSKALEQGGYFTAKQAIEAGYGYPHLDYHVSTGAFQRVDQGLYRLTNIPPAEHDDLIQLSLWSRDRQDRTQAVVSHESALVLHDLSELLPDKIHCTVPPRFRKRPPQGCVLHKAILLPSEWKEWTGFRVATPLRTLLDVAKDGISQEQLEKAASEALSRGLVRQRSLRAATRNDPRWQRLLKILEEKQLAAT